MSARTVAYVVGLCGMGAACFWLGGRQERQMQPKVETVLAAPGMPAPAQTSFVLNAPSAVDHAALENVVRDAVRAELARNNAAAGQASSPTEKYGPTIDPVAAASADDKGRGIVARAVAAGRWNDADRTAFRETFHAMTADAREEVLTQLIPAINQDKIRVDISEPLLF